MEQLNLVILGGTGFVGSALLRRIAAFPPKAVNVRVLARNLNCKLPLTSATVIQGSLPYIPPSLFPKEPHVIIHLATKQIDLNRSGYEHTNVYGTERLLSMTSSSTLGMIYASSASVYGQGPHQGLQENTPVSPQTDLARSRAKAEAVILKTMAEKNKNAVILRPRFVLGTGDRHTLPGLIKMIQGGFLVGSGQQTYSVIDVDDYAEIILRMAQKIFRGRHEDRKTGKAFNVGYRQPLSLSEIITSVCETMGLAQPQKKIPVRPQVPKILRRFPFAGTASLAARFELIGFSQYFNVDELSTEIAPDITGKDPLAVFKKSLDCFLNNIQMQPPLSNRNTIL